MVNPQRFQIKIGERYTDKLVKCVHWTNTERSEGPKGQTWLTRSWFRNL